MKRLLIVFVALMAILAWGAVAAAADFQFYAEYGLGIEQYFGSDPIDPSLSVTPWAVGGTCQFDRWLIGGDYLVRGIDGFAWPSVTGSIVTYDIYGGYKLIDTGCFKVYALLGYAHNLADFDCAIGSIVLEYAIEAGGCVAGIGAQAVAGPFVFDGKVLTTVGGWARESFFIYFSDYQVGVYHNFDSGTLLLADLRGTWKVSDLFGLYVACRYIETSADDGGANVPLGHAVWYSAGIRLYF